MNLARSFRKGAVTWRNAADCVCIALGLRRNVATRLRPVLDSAAMSKNGDFHDFYTQCRGWSIHLIRTYPTFDDIEAVIAASIWEHYSSGVDDEREMFRRVRVDVRRHVRTEARQSDIRQRLRHSEDHSRISSRNDEIDDALDAIATVQRLAKIDVPAAVRPWVEHVSAEVKVPIPHAQRMAGRRWAENARKVLANA